MLKQAVSQLFVKVLIICQEKTANCLFAASQIQILLLFFVIYQVNSISLSFGLLVRQSLHFEDVTKGSGKFRLAFFTLIRYRISYRIKLYMGAVRCNTCNRSGDRAFIFFNFNFSECRPGFSLRVVL